jgi:1,4-dihydroxy-2-naphthoate octaprenyltransferase
VAEVLKRMQDAVEPRRLWRISGLHRDFEGVLSMTGFKICRVINYRNSFLPIVVGKMLPRLQGGTRIEVQMRMQWIVTAFMLLWAGFPVLLLTTALLHIDIGILDSRAPQGLRPHQFAAAIAMVVFGYVLCAVAFNIEAKRAQVLLLKILDVR